MNLIGRIAGLSGTVLATAGCVQRVDIEITAIELVESLPVGKISIEGGEDPRAGNSKIAEAGFVRVQFQTKANLQHQGAYYHTAAFVRPCGPRSDQGPSYIEHSSIFPADDGSFTAFFPARLDMYVRRDAEGGLNLGWPDATLANGLCFQVSGMDMMHFGLQSDEVRLERMADFLKR